MTLEITSTSSRLIVDKTNLPVRLKDAELHLKHEMNGRLPALVALIGSNPVRGQVRLGQQITNVVSAVRRLLWRLDYDGDSPPNFDESHGWPPAISALLYAREDDRGTTAKRLQELTHLLFWLKFSLQYLEKDLVISGYGTAPNAALQSTIAVRQFCWDLLAVYATLFGRRPSASYTTTREAGRRPTGPTFRYLTAILLAVRTVLTENGLEELARDRGLNPSDETIQKWIRRFLADERELRSPPDVTRGA